MVTISSLVIALAIVGQGGKREAVVLLPGGVFSKEDMKRLEYDPLSLFEIKGRRQAHVRVEFGKSPKQLWEDHNIHYVLQIVPKHVGSEIERLGFAGRQYAIPRFAVSYTLMMRGEEPKQPQVVVSGKYSFSSRAVGTPSQAVAVDLRLLTSRAIYGALARRVFSERWQVQSDDEGGDRKDVFKKKLVASAAGRNVELRAVNTLPVSVVCDFNFYAGNRDYFTRSELQQVDTRLEPSEERIINFVLKDETAESVLVWPRIQILDPELEPVP